SASTRAIVTGFANLKAVDTAPLIAWLFKDALIASVNEEIDTFANDDVALTDEQRKAKGAELIRTILSLERDDVDLTEAAAGAVAFRPDTDPRAFLALADEMPGETDDLA